VLLEAIPLAVTLSLKESDLHTIFNRTFAKQYREQQEREMHANHPAASSSTAPGGSGQAGSAGGQQAGGGAAGGDAPAAGIKAGAAVAGSAKSVSALKGAAGKGSGVGSGGVDAGGGSPDTAPSTPTPSANTGAAGSGSAAASGGGDGGGGGDHHEQMWEHAEINDLLFIAMRLLPTIPYSMGLDKWRTGVFSGKIGEAQYEHSFWEMMGQEAGIAPSADVAKASDHLFSPGANFEVVSNTESLQVCSTVGLQNCFWLQTVCLVLTKRLGVYHRGCSAPCWPSSCTEGCARRSWAATTSLLGMHEELFALN
jgi:hypothetical protein